MISGAILCLLFITCKATTLSVPEESSKPYSDRHDNDLPGLNSAAFLLSHLILADRGGPSQSAPEEIDSSKSKALRTLGEILNNRDITEKYTRDIRAYFTSGGHSGDFNSDSVINPVVAFFALRKRTNEYLKVDNESQLFGKRTMSYCTACGRGHTSPLTRHPVMLAHQSARSVKSLFEGKLVLQMCSRSDCSGGGVGTHVQVAEHFYGTSYYIIVQVDEFHKLPITIDKTILVGEETYVIFAILTDTSMANVQRYGIILFNDKLEGHIAYNGRWNPVENEDFLNEKNAQLHYTPVLVVYRRQQKPSQAEQKGPETESGAKSLISTALDHILHKIDAPIDSLPPYMQFSFSSQPHQMSSTGHKITPPIGGLFHSVFNKLPLKNQGKLAADFVMAEKSMCLVPMCNRFTYANFLPKFYFPIRLSGDGKNSWLKNAVLQALVSLSHYYRECLRCGGDIPHSNSLFIAKWPEKLMVLELSGCQGLDYSSSRFRYNGVHKDLEAFITRSHEHRFDLYLRQVDSWMGPSGSLSINEISKILRNPTKEILLFYL